MREPLLRWRSLSRRDQRLVRLGPHLLHADDASCVRLKHRDGIRRAITVTESAPEKRGRHADFAFILSP